MNCFFYIFIFIKRIRFKWKVFRGMKFDVCMIGKTTVLVICIYKRVKSIVFIMSIKILRWIGSSDFNIFKMPFKNWCNKQLRRLVCCLKIILSAITWLKYCQYSVKLYPINQSINHLPSKCNIHCTAWLSQVVRNLHLVFLLQCNAMKHSIVVCL